MLLTTRRRKQVDGGPLRLGPLRRASRAPDAKPAGRRAAAEGRGDRLCHLVGDLPPGVHLVSRHLATGTEAPKEFVRRLETDP